MTNRDLYNHMWFWAIVFSLGIGLLSGYLAFNGLLYTFCNPYSYYSSSDYRCKYFDMNSIQAGINAGISLTVIGGVFGLCSCLWLGKRLEKAEQTITTSTATRNTPLTETTTTRNQGATDLNPLGQEVRNLGAEVNANHEVIELNPLGQEVRNLGAETINLEQDQNQLENQINQQQETRIEVIPS